MTTPATARAQRLSISVPAADFDGVGRSALLQSSTLLPEWLPGGKMQGREYVACNPTRQDQNPGSFKINVDSGAWADFATGDSGGDLISLHAYLHGSTQGEAAQELAHKLGLGSHEGPGTRRSHQGHAEVDQAEIVTPVPGGLGKMPLPANIPEGARRSGWKYLDAEGRLLFWVCRFDLPDGSKEIRPLTCWRSPGQAPAWRWKAHPAPRPLYGLDLMASKPGAPILVVEGEKAADAAQGLFPDMVAVTSSGGGKAASKSEWAPLQGRAVTIWPDADSPGKAYAEAVGRLALEAGAASVHVVRVPDDFPKGWDLADQLPEGCDSVRLSALLKGAQSIPGTVPQARMQTGPPPDWPFRVNDSGVFKRVERENKQSGEVVIDWLRVCSRLDVSAETRDAEGRSWGRLLAVTTREGLVNEWAMPMELLAGDGSSYRAELLNLGLEISPGVPARNALHEYISTARPPERARCVDRVGWHEQVFVLPDQAYGMTQGDRVLFQVGATRDHQFLVKGTLEGWQEEIARPCVGNTRPAFAVCAAFTAPLLHLVGAEGGGFHFRGGSSIGKTTALHVAGSVWGGGGINGYCRNWRATSNGLETVGVAHCDALLCLDEMGQVDGREAGEVAYMLSNGQGKSRARRDGSGRAPAQWRVLFLSTGELALADKVHEGGRRARAGQEVRLVDIPADAGAGLGILEELHGFADPGTLADHLRLASGQYYGVAARAFLEQITAKLEGLGEIVRGARQEFIGRHCPQDADGQVKRVADRFALVAAGGTLATAAGLLPWPGSEAERSAAACFRAWLDQRGGTGPAETREGIAQVRAFFQAHGASRFEPWGGASEARPILNRAGFKREDSLGGTEFFVFSAVFRREVCNGFDARLLSKELVRLGLLLPGSDNKPQSTHRPPATGKPARFYHFGSEVLSQEDSSD